MTARAVMVLVQRSCRACLWSGLASSRATSCPACGGQLRLWRPIPLSPYQPTEDDDALL